MLEGGGGADCTVREDGGGEGHSEPPPLQLHASERRGARLLRLTRSHATGGTRINDTQTVAGPTTQATATRSTTHNKDHARTGREGVP